MRAVSSTGFSGSSRRRRHEAASVNLDAARVRWRRVRVSEPESVVHLQELLARLEATLAELEGTEDPGVAVERLADMAELAKEVQSEIDRAKREGPDALP
jgi:hypothetical protein